MSCELTLLLTAPDDRLLADLARLRPAWRVLDLDQGLPLNRPSGPQWAFVDWLCAAMSGLEMCRRLRESPATHDAHVTMVLDDHGVETRRRAMLAGADDYLVGPLDLPALLARIDHAETPASPSRRHLVNGAITLDPQAYQVRVHGTPVAMRPNEFRLLAHFMQNPDQVFSRAALIDNLGKDAGHIDERTVDVWVGRLRRALIAHGIPDPLRTVRSLGYVMDSTEA